MKTMHPDQMALKILLDGSISERERANRIAAVRKAVRDRRSGGACPECGHDGPHDDNGAEGDDRSFCCTECGEHWDA